MKDNIFRKCREHLSAPVIRKGVTYVNSQHFATIQNHFDRLRTHLSLLLFSYKKKKKKKGTVVGTIDDKYATVKKKQLPLVRIVI